MKTDKTPQDQVPEHLRGRWGGFFQWLGKVVLSSIGWQVTGNIPNEERLLIIAAPHTSNWDFILGISALFAINVNIKWLGKNSLFIPGIAWFFKWLGGIPVNRENPNLLIDYVVKTVEKEKGLIIGIAPEGSRKKVDRWKSGFLRIAKQTDAKILFLSIDAPSKKLKIGEIFEPSGDNEKDIKFVMNYFKQYKGINPDQSNN
jgi:1-acyl-sn-glycerol-3-phosphate acyltransferase